jgi:hypothetical protein
MDYPILIMFPLGLIIQSKVIKNENYCIGTSSIHGCKHI